MFGLLAKTLRSSTLKLALIWIATFGAAILVLLGFVYRSTASYVRSRSDDTITAERVLLQRVYDSAGRGGLISTIGQRIAEGRLDGGRYLLADGSLTPVAGNLTAWPSALKGADGWDNFSDPAADQALLRGASNTLPDGYHLLVGKNIDDLDEFARKMKTALLWATALIFVLAGLASLTVTRRTVGRIESINATSRAIIEGGLGKRIPLRGTRDEWDQLAESLNLMLDRIEGLMAEVKQVTDNLAHDLRTPLARIRGRLERAHNNLREGDYDGSLICDTIADLDGVLRMFSSLTRISQIEANDRTAAFRTVNLAEIAGEVVELFDAAAEDRGIKLNTLGAQRVLITGDRDLLFDAVGNLVDNAIKHGREGGRATVEVIQRGGSALISVADDGPGIPVNERQHVFKRFYRLERSRRTPGNGLGLSLVAAVACLHRAHIDLADNAPGLKFQLWFPSRTDFGIEKENLLEKEGG